MQDKIYRKYKCDRCGKVTEHECYRDPPSFPQARFIRCRVCNLERQTNQITNFEDWTW